MPRLILFVLLAGLVVYGLVWLTMRLRDRRAAATPPRPAPDDDPAFLARVDQQLREQRRRAERERKAHEEAAGTAPTPSPTPPSEPESTETSDSTETDDSTDPEPRKPE